MVLSVGCAVEQVVPVSQRKYKHSHVNSFPRQTRGHEFGYAEHETDLLDFSEFHWPEFRE